MLTKIASMCIITVPGVAGDGGADNSVEQSDGQVPLMEETVDPLVRKDVR